MSKLKALKSVGEKVAVPVATGVAGTVIANQFPQNQRSTKRVLEEHKKDVKKNLAPIIKSDDPLFNHKAAQVAANMVMALDDDSAYMFSKLLMAEIVQDDIEKNRRTLQRHLDDVVHKRIERIKKSMLRSISKVDRDDAMLYAEALEVIEKAWSNQYTTGQATFNESDFRRNAKGQFTTKIKHNPNAKKLSDKQAANLGIPVNSEKYKALSSKEQAQYQQEWMQLANFLNTVAESGQLGDNDVHLHVQDANGQRYYHKLNGKPQLGTHWNPKEGDRLVGASATPSGPLTLGGASFGLVNALGSSGNARTVGTINRADENFNDFANDWATASNTGSRNSNDRLYNRVKHGSQFVATVAPDNSKIQLAARLASAVGEHGPEAEKVLGPTSRKLAYRYRGTEKKPDRDAVREYNAAVGAGDGGELPLSEEHKRRRDQYVQRFVDRYAAEKATRQGLAGPEAVKMDRDETKQVRALGEQKWRKLHPEAYRTTGLGEREQRVDSGLAELGHWLMDTKRNPKAPSKDLYDLQLKSGNTPVSTGFIIDAQGNIVAQAQGYGDDHYVPFNLKNLKALKGGSYVRTRSVGGPTAEDIYTGLMSGARSIVVVSRSGYYKVDFNPETASKPRFNDKARRMVRRYEHILDAVQSEQVKRNQAVPEMVQTFFTRKVNEKFPGETPRNKRARVKAELENYKREQQNSTFDRPDWDAYVETELGDVSDLSQAEKNVLAAQFRSDWAKHNEFEFKLNGNGYRDALKALEEQFPYYITVKSGPLREEEQFSGERDRGYVEPGRNRPSEARAGWYGTRENPGNPEKFSASQADFQGWRKGTPAPAPAAEAAKPEEGEGGAAAPTAPAEGPKPPTGLEAITAEAEQRSKAIARQGEEKNYVDAALALTKALRDDVDWGDAKDDAHKRLPALAMKDDSAIRDFYSRDVNQRPADEILRSIQVEGGGALPPSVKKAIEDYGKATGQLDRVGYDPKLKFSHSGVPFRFDGPAYQKGADPDVVNSEIERIVRNTKPVSDTGQTLAQMDEEDLGNELDILDRVNRAMPFLERIPPEDMEERKDKMHKLGVDPDYPGVMHILEGGAIDEHAENVQRMRSLLHEHGPGVGGEKTQYQLPPGLERTERLQPTPEEESKANKQTASGTAQMLENAAHRLEQGLNWDEDHPRNAAGSALRRAAKKFKDLSKLQELDASRLDSARDQSAQEIMFANRVQAGEYDDSLVERFLDKLGE